VEREEAMSKRGWSILINIFACFWIFNTFKPYLMVSILTISSGNIGLLSNNLYDFFVARLWFNITVFLLGLTLGIGILRRNDKIRKFVVYSSLLIVIVGVLFILFRQTKILTSIFAIIFGSLEIWLFSHPKVKELFKNGALS
jgi:hypothetical protein